MSDAAVAEKPAPKITKLTYMPMPGDKETVTVAGTTLRAYEPVDIADDAAGAKLAHLASNPWFSTGDVSAERKAAWQATIDSRKAARDKQDEADEADLERRRIDARANPSIHQRPLPEGFVPAKEGDSKPEPSVLIAPTIGRVVWYWAPYNPNIPPRIDEQPLAAIVAYVHHDRLVNLMVINHDGGTIPTRNVDLLQEDDVRPRGGFCEWMPFQRGQAAKADGVRREPVASPPIRQNDQRAQRGLT